MRASRHWAVLVAAAIAASASAATPAAGAGRCGDVSERPWCDTALSPESRAELLLSELTLDEKISLLAGDELAGVSGGEGMHTGTSEGIPRVGIPTIYFSDGPVGSRQGKATGMPSPISLAATFDPRAAFRHARVVGDEVKKKGNDVIYAPAMNMQRIPLNGRTFEYFGEDPFLAARIAVGWTRGVQSTGVIATAKHFAVNNQEGAPCAAVPEGTPLGAACTGSRMTLDARVEERPLREIYLPQFEATVTEAGVGSIMCAYPRVNGQYACENAHLLEDILKGDWGFDGFVLTDYGAAKNTDNSLNNGLDLDIWPGLVLNPANVQVALTSGRVSPDRIDEAVRRQLRTYFAFGVFDRDAYVDDSSRIAVDAHHAAAAAIESRGIVLLRNERGMLPLDPNNIGKLALIGPEADRIRDGGGSSAINEFRVTTPKQALEAALGQERIVYADGSDTDAAVAAAKEAEIAVVIIGDRMTEGQDKPCLGINCGQTDGIDRDALVEAVAAANPNTVVVLQSGGPVLLPWRDKVKALVEAWYPGQNGGTAIARVLLGQAEPGGRLPTTFPLRDEDLPTAGDPERYPGVGETAHYKEGVLIGYRWFDEHALDVAYPFGFGLSYTQFRYRKLRFRPSRGPNVKVSAVVKNVGTRAGSAVPQLYVGMPEPRAGEVQPPFQLKAFKKVRLRPLRSRRVTFTLDDRGFSWWAGTRFAVARGCYRVGIGPHSRDLPLQGVVGRGTATCKGARTLIAPLEARSCTRKRVARYRLPRRARRMAVTVAGRPVRPIRRGGRLIVRVRLRPGRQVTVAARGRMASGSPFQHVRVYRSCARRARRASSDTSSSRL